MEKLGKIVGLLVVIAVFGITFLGNIFNNDNFDARVTILNIGQGDAVLVELPNQQRWLIDGGPDSKVVSELQKVLPFGDRNLTGIILTHPHSDHVSGLVNVLQQFNVEYAIFVPMVHTSPVYQQFLQTIKDKNIQAIAMTEPFVWQDQVNNWQWEFLYPSEDIEFANLNDSSIVSKLTVKGKSFLFTGDAEKEVEQLLLQQYDLKADVLKVGHHGSDTSTTEKFLQEVNPEYALISVGEGNSFGHPNEGVINLLEKYGVKIYRTDKNGRVSVTMENNNLNIISEY